MKNYKTTITALAGNIFLLVNFYFGEIVPIPIAVGIVTLAVALFTKDFDTTGNGSDAAKGSSFRFSNISGTSGRPMNFF